MKPDIYLCRHGETEWTLSGQHTGVSDISLTEQGKKQALLLGRRLRNIPFTKVFSSPKIRALETCKLAGFNNPVLETDAVEWNYGAYEGLTRNEIAEQNPSWDLFSQGAPQGEAPKQIAHRADALIAVFLKEQGPIALFSHGHFLRVLASRWCGLDAQHAKCFSLSVASLSVLGFERTQPVIKLWNDTSHLTV